MLSSIMFLDTSAGHLDLYWRPSRLACRTKWLCRVAAYPQDGSLMQAFKAHSLLLSCCAWRNCPCTFTLAVSCQIHFSTCTQAAAVTPSALLPVACFRLFFFTFSPFHLFNTIHISVSSSVCSAADVGAVDFDAGFAHLFDVWNPSSTQ